MEEPIQIDSPVITSANTLADKMNKSDLVRAIATQAGLTQTDATKALDGLVSTLTEALKEGKQVSLLGFGTFSIKERAARKGRNPRTKESIDIKSSRIPTFKAGKALKDAVN